MISEVRRIALLGLQQTLQRLVDAAQRRQGRADRQPAVNILAGKPAYFVWRSQW